MGYTTINSAGIVRPMTLVWAVALIAVGIVANLATLPVQPDDAPPIAVLVTMSLALSALWLVGAWGLWQGWRWAAVLTFVVTVLNGLATAPGIFFAEELWINIGCVIGVIHAIALCSLLVTKSTREGLR
jgi:hypothetical protein